MDLTAVFQTVASGGPDVIFLLCTLCALFLTGEIRPKREVEDRDQVIKALEERNEKLDQRNEDMGRRYDKEHELFEQALTLINDTLLPMMREDHPRRRD